MNLREQFLKSVEEDSPQAFLRFMEQHVSEVLQIGHAYGVIDRSASMLSSCCLNSRIRVIKTKVSIETGINRNARFHGLISIKFNRTRKRYVDAMFLNCFQFNAIELFGN